MRAGAIISIVFGILLLIGGIIFLALYGIGDANSKFENEIDVPNGQFYVVGDKTASKITGEYSASEPIEVYVTTDESVKSGLIWSIDSLSDVEKLDEGKSSGSIDYETSKSDDTYFLLFNNPNDSSVHLSVDVEFHNEGMSTICLIPGFIMLIIGIVLLAVGMVLRKKYRAEGQYQPQEPTEYSAPTSVPIQPGYQPKHQPAYQSTMKPSSPRFTYSEDETHCPQCNRPLNFMMQYQKWYCTTCQKYF
jgi:hypothetical protein